MQQWTCLFGLWHATISGIYMTTGNDQLSGWIKKELQSISQSQTCTNKRSWSYCLVVCCWSASLQLSESQQNWSSMLSKSMRCTENRNTYSRRYSTERAQFFSVTTPNCMLHNQCFKSWTNWAVKFCFICHIHLTSHQLTTTSSSILTIFCRENVSTTSRMQKMLSKYSSSVEA